MSQVVNAIKTRRSIRKYLPRKVSTELITEILEAAGWAPSAHNAQPWRFIVLADKVLKQDLAEAMADARIRVMLEDDISPELCDAKAKASVGRFTQAPVLIVACLTTKDMHQYEDGPRRECEHDLAVQSLGAAIQNMLLVAHTNGLGACWFCAPIFCKDAVRRVLHVPEDVEPQALIALGYAAEKPSVPPRKPLQSYARWNGWGKKV
jgi:F420 biosynthesis protein FbiB-like protein